MNVVRAMWNSVKRNPVINAAIVAIVGQVIVHAIENGEYDVKTLSVYALQLSLAFVAREFTVPYKEHEIEVKESYMRGLVVPHAAPGEEFPGDAK